MSSGPIPIIALDVPTMADAKVLVAKLGGSADFYKVGLQLFTREGPAVVEWLRAASKRVFLDLKLHDIPNTVKGAAASAAALGVDLLTVHAIGGDAMVRAAVDGAGSRTGILAVTVLTSFDDAAYAAATGLPAGPASAQVYRLALVAAAAGARGVVCAGAEAGEIRRNHGPAFGTLVPGLRMEGGATHDQARVSTPAEVVVAGATWVVVGRAVTAAPDPAAACEVIKRALLPV